MTRAKAIAVQTAIVNAGFNCVTRQVDEDAWTVRAEALTVSIPVASAQALATAQGVTALVSEVDFS